MFRKSPASNGCAAIVEKADLSQIPLKVTELSKF